MYPRSRPKLAENTQYQKSWLNSTVKNGFDIKKNLNNFEKSNKLPSINIDNNNDFLIKNRINSSINPSSRKAGEFGKLIPLTTHTNFNKNNFNKTNYNDNSNFGGNNNGNVLDPIARFEQFQKMQLKKFTADEKKQNTYFEVEHKRSKEKIQSQEKAFHYRKVLQDEIQKQNWMRDMEIKRNFEMKLEEEKNELSKNFQKLLSENWESEEKKTFIEINKFEKNLSKLGLDMANIDPKLKKTGKNVISSELVLQKITEQIRQKEIAKKERERRQRKILHEQNKIQDDMKRNNQSAGKLLGNNSNIINNKMNLSNTNNLNESNYFDNKKFNITTGNMFMNNLNININNNEDYNYSSSALIKRQEYEKVRDLHSRAISRDLQRKKHEEMFKIERENRPSVISGNNEKNISFNSSENYVYNNNGNFLSEHTNGNNINNNREFIYQPQKKEQKFNKDEFFMELYQENLQTREKNLKLKLEKRERNILKLKQLTDYLLEFTDEIFTYQTENKTDQIPLNTWNDYCIMFINNIPFKAGNRKKSGYFDVKTSENDENNENEKNSNNDYSILQLNNPYNVLNVNYNNANNIEFSQNQLFYFNENNISRNENNNNKKPASGRKKKVKDNNDSDSICESTSVFNSYGEFFDESELYDYMNYLGNYKASLIPEMMHNKMLDYFEVMKTSEASNKKSVTFSNQLTVGNFNNNTGKLSVFGNNNIISSTLMSGEYELKDEDIENLTIPAENCKNYLFSDVVGIIIELKFKDFQNNNSNTNINTKNSLGINSNFNNNNNQNEKSPYDFFSQIPLKLAFVGKAFAGKKTQIKLLSESYNLKLYNIDDIIAKNLGLIEKLETPIEQIPKYRTMKKHDIEKLIAERNAEEEKISGIKNFLLRIREYIQNNEEIDDDLLIDFILEIIKADFSYQEKTNEKLFDEVSEKIKKKKELTEQIFRLQEEKKLPISNSNGHGKEKDKKTSIVNNTKQQDIVLNNLIQELNKLNEEWNRGFCMYNFPKNLHQAKKFEKKICNYIVEIEKPKSYLDYIKDNFFCVLDKLNKPNSNANNHTSVFNLIFYLSLDNNEALRRAKGRKIDPNTGVIYHLDDNPPPHDDKKLNEKLESLDTNFNFESLQKSNNLFDENISGLINFYIPFGHVYPKLNINLGLFNEINLNNLMFELNKNSDMNSLMPNKATSELAVASSTNLIKIDPKTCKRDYKSQINLVNNEINTIIKQYIQIKEDKEYEFIGSTNPDGNNGKNFINNTSITSKNLVNTNEKNKAGNNSFSGKENANTPNTNINKEQNLGIVNNNPNNHIMNPLNTSNINNISKTRNNRNNLSKENSNNNNFNNNNNILNENNLTHQNTKNLNNIGMTNDFSNINQSNLRDNIFLEEYFSSYNRKFEDTRKRMPMPVVDKIFSDWRKLYEHYTKNLKQIFKGFIKQREAIALNFHNVQEKFIEFLRRSSEKIHYAQKMQTKYNKFIDDYPQLKHDKQVKNEFHQDVSEMEDQIWEIIQQRKNESIIERKKIINCGYIKNEMERFYKRYLERLFVLETEKFYNSIIIMRDFYTNLDFKIPSELFSFKPLDILLDADLDKNPIFIESELRNYFEKDNKGNNKKNFRSNSSSSLLEEGFNSPRIEKLFNNCIKMLIKYDEIRKNFEKNYKNQMLYNNSISNDSMALKKTSKVLMGKKTVMQDSIFSDDKKDLLFLDEELKTAIKQEKNKYKFRIAFLKFWGLNSLKNIRNIAKIVYDKLDEWIINTVKTENEVMNNLAEFLDECIEKELKIKLDIELDSFDFYRIVDPSDHFEITVIKNFIYFLLIIFFKNINLIL